MSTSLASFRELRGVGPAAEARLHDAGIYTWAALSEVLAVLGRVRRHPAGSGDPLADLAEQVAALVGEAGGQGAPRLPDGERSEAFLLRLALSADGGPLRSSVTNVRTQTELPWAGWSPAELISFVEEQSGVRGPTGATASATAAQAGSATGSASSASSSAQSDAPAADHVAGRSGRNRLLVLDAGKAIGGRPRDVTLDVVTEPLAGVEEFEFDATLAARDLGPGPSGGSGWVTVATRHGVGHPPTTLPLHFEGVALSPGVQRLRLELAVRLPDGGPVPALDLAG